MELADVAVPAVSAAGGGLTVGWFLRLVVGRYLKAHDDMATALHGMTIQLTRIEERVGALQTAAAQTQANATGLAVVQTQVAKLATDLNGLGSKVRSIQSGECDEQ